jgi:hypothetical protein
MIDVHYLKITDLASTPVVSTKGMSIHGYPLPGEYAVVLFF